MYLAKSTSISVGYRIVVANIHTKYCTFTTYSASWTSYLYHIAFFCPSNHIILLSLLTGNMEVRTLKPGAAATNTHIHSYLSSYNFNSWWHLLFNRYVVVFVNVEMDHTYISIWYYYIHKCFNLMYGQMIHILALSIIKKTPTMGSWRVVREHIYGTGYYSYTTQGELNDG